MEYIIIGLFIITIIAFGIILRTYLLNINIKNGKKQAELLIEKANQQAKNTIKQAILDGKTQVYDLKLQAEKEFKEKRKELLDNENKLLRREDSLNFRDETISKKEQSLESKLQNVKNKLEKIENLEKDLQDRISSQVVVLEKISNMTESQAKEQILSIVEKRMDKEIGAYIHDRLEEAESTANINAQNLIAMAIQKHASDEVIERCTSTVTLPNEDMKGSIIGREGRNIKALEQATGVDLIIDDTPNIITVSCFDPIRREIARLALENLLKDGRIQPGRIEEVVSKVKKQIGETINKAGEEACFKLGITKIDKELVRLIGRLRYRYSFGQNCLTHSIEVAKFASTMANELGLNANIAKRAGLLHDIGKSIDFEVDGTHVELGAKLARKYKENDIVIDAILSHHGDKEPTNTISYLVAAADALSAGRPGARYEGIENYINRLEQLEKLGNSFEGVEKTYAIQAGREVRVIVIPEKVDDQKCYLIAQQLKEQIEETLQYPGQIKVTVIRETRANEIAK